MKNHYKLSSKERDGIAVWRAQGRGIREIARQLKRSPGTISDECRRNRYRDGYVAIHAQRLTERRKAHAPNAKHPLKNPDIYAATLNYLRWGWSPEQISGRLHKNHPDDRHWSIHPETIYRFIYHPNQHRLMLWEYLPWKRKKRRKKQGRSVHRSRIPDRVSIQTRPAEINDRTEFGHWEGDTVEGKGHREGIHTEAGQPIPGSAEGRPDCLPGNKPGATADLRPITPNSPSLDDAGQWTGTPRAWRSSPARNGGLLC